MGIPQEAERAKLILGVLSAPKKLDEILRAAAREFTSIEDQLPPFEFTLTDYYFKEMGRPLMRTWVSLEGLVPQDSLRSIKLRTNELERSFSVHGNRLVNLDPGLLVGSKLVLASTKDFAHRIYLGDGIHAEVTLVYRTGEGFTPLAWTYPDYRLTEVLAFFNSVRAKYRDELRALKRTREENA